MKTLAELKSLRPSLAAAAQKIYDAWDQSGEDGDPDLGFGGICQDVASAMSEVLDENEVESATVEAQIGEQHVFVVARIAEGVYEVDISPYVYETGAGYSWTKRQGIVIEVDDVSLALLSGDPDAFDLYAGGE